MSNYSKSTDFASKDTLSPGDPNKIVKGTEIDAEFEAIETAVNSKINVTDIGTTVQAYDADLTTLGAGGAGARSFLGLATIASSGSASDLSTGTVGTARLGSGTASSSTYLRGDQTWAEVSVVVPVDVQTFNSTGTWTKPTGGQTMCRVQVWGAGGGGGLTSGWGVGGAGGGYNEWTGDISQIATQTVTVGSGGTGTGTNNTNAGTGGTSSVAITGKTISATGGGGGRAANVIGFTTIPGSPFGLATTGVGNGSLPLSPWHGGSSGYNASCGSGGAGSSIFGGGGGGTAGAGTSGYGGNGGNSAAGVQPGGGGGGANAGGAGRVVITCW